MALALPKALSDLAHYLGRLPGVGPKSAERMALALADWDESGVSALAAALTHAADTVSECPDCGCLAQDGKQCSVCSDGGRDRSKLCVVESALDAIALERGGIFDGLYHVLGGVLNPLKGVLPEDLRLAELLERIDGGGVSEVIIATNISPDGEATALLLLQELEGRELSVTRLARGLPSGGQLDYADAATLQSAFEHRTKL